MTSVHANQLAITEGPSRSAQIQALAVHNFAALSSEERLAWTQALCESVGVNMLSKPIDWITLQGKLTPYANKGFAEQLRKLNDISIEVMERKQESGCVVVRVRASTPDGRCDESMGAVAVADGAKGEAWANAWMKAETKAKRRATLSLVGLGLMDESELDTLRAEPVASEPVRKRVTNLNETLGLVETEPPAPRLVEQTDVVPNFEDFDGWMCEMDKLAEQMGLDVHLARKATQAAATKRKFKDLGATDPEFRHLAYRNMKEGKYDATCLRDAI